MIQDDMVLVQEFAATHSEVAFATLVERYLALVYSAAIRQACNTHLAEEITQAVFIIFARKASSMKPDLILPAWLYRTTRFVAANALKIQRRRLAREQEAYMESLSENMADSQQNDTLADAWQQMAPVLDEAMADLGERDRAAVVLRYFENRPWQEVASLLQVTEDAAQKRVTRALEKLRKLFAKRGVALSGALIASVVVDNSVQAAPMALAKMVSVVALTKGATASASALTVVKGALKMMAWSEAKMAVAIGVGILLVTGTVMTATKRFSISPNQIQFEAEGTITYATAPDPRGSYTDTKHFVVMRVGNRWKIRTATIKEGRTGTDQPLGDSMDLYYEMGFDGTNIYRLLQQDEKKVLAPVPAKERGKWVFAEGDVFKADSPPYNDTHQFYSVWLAYCSMPYFGNLSGSIAVSPAFGTRDFIGERIAKMQSPAKWKAHDKYFMDDVSWLSDGTYNAFLPTGKETNLRYQAPYDFPFVWGRFENLAWTNWNGVSIPSSFKITVSRPDYASTNVARFLTAYTISGTLDQVHQLGTFSPVPELTTKTHITDWRNLIGRQPTMFVSTNRWKFSRVAHP